MEMELSESIGYLVLGGIFAFVGYSLLRSQSGKVGIGGGRSGGSPLFEVELHGTLARICGAILILGALLLGLPFFLLMFGNSGQSDFITWLPFVGIVVLFTASFLSAIIQLAISVGEKLKAVLDKSKNDINGNAS